jgi:hypothetical protein
MEPDFRAGGRRSAKQCSDTNYFVARDCSGATRSAESRRMNTAEINAALMNSRLLTCKDVNKRSNRRKPRLSKREVFLVFLARKHSRRISRHEQAVAE